MLRCCCMKASPFQCLVFLFLTVTFPQYFIALLESWYHLHPSDSLSVPHHLLPLWFFIADMTLSLFLISCLSQSPQYFIAVVIATWPFPICDYFIMRPLLPLSPSPTCPTTFLFFSFFSKIPFRTLLQEKREEWHRMGDCKRRLFALRKTGFPFF